MIMARLHRSGGEVILAACDAEIFGKCLESEGVKLDLSSGFFDGEEVTEEEFCGMLEAVTSANLVGPNVVALAVKMGAIHPDAVIEVCGVPHAMYVCM